MKTKDKKMNFVAYTFQIFNVHLVILLYAEEYYGFTFLHEGLNMMKLTLCKLYSLMN